MKLNQLTFAALRLANIARLPEFKNKKGEPAHSKPDGSDWTPLEWCDALAGEVGELSNIVKKVIRKDVTRDDALESIREELADVACYLDLLAFQFRIDLGAAVRDKFNRVSARVGSNVILVSYAHSADDDRQAAGWDMTGFEGRLRRRIRENKNTREVEEAKELGKDPLRVALADARVKAYQSVLADWLIMACGEKAEADKDMSL